MNFEFARTQEFVWIYCGFIFVVALVCGAKLARDARASQTKIRELKDELDAIDGRAGFADAFERYKSRVEAALGLPWTKFVETLVFPQPGSSHSIRNASEVSRYLNDATIIFPLIAFGFYRSIPNLLTGLGILGTFIGLASGVGAASTGLSSGDPGEITSSLQRLLNGASLAFWTSITGISCSILFVLVERYYSRSLHLVLGQWVDAIEFRLERVTPEGIALQQLEEAKRAATQLERFNTELIFSLEKALDEKIAGRLSPQLERLVEAVEGLRTDRSSEAGRVIEQALSQFIDSMKEQTGSQFKEMASTVADLNRTLADASAELRKTVGSTTQALARTGVEAAGHISGTLRDVQTSAKSLAQFAMLNEQVLSDMKALVGGLDGLRDCMESAQRQIAAVAKPIEHAASDIRASSDRTAETLAQTSNLVGRVEALVNTLEKHQGSVANAWTRYQERFEDIDESLARVFQQIDDGLARYCEQVKQFANDLDGVTSKTIQDLSSATGELSESIEDLTEHLSRSR